MEEDVQLSTMVILARVSNVARQDIGQGIYPGDSNCLRFLFANKILGNAQIILFQGKSITQPVGFSSDNG